MAWTSEQQQAITKDGTNIIVSAGAGSGKTAVLTERVIRKIKDGVHINQLLIMTFTNAAAKEMKDRIRKKLTKEGYIEEVNLIDSSYITTFDSFSLSIVKKYNYLLNLPKNIDITDNSILTIEKQKLMDSIFDDYYLNENDKFKKFIKDFCYKDDDNLKRLLIRLNDKLDMKIDKSNYLENYISNYYNDTFIENSINEYFLLIKEEINYIEEIMELLSNYLDSSYIEKLYEAFSGLLNAKNYDEVIRTLDFTIPRLPKTDDEEVKNIKDKITKSKENIKKLCIYNSIEEMKNEYLETKDNMEIIIELVILFDKKLNDLKKNKNIYSFTDISRMAIKIIEDNSDVCKELRESFNEIMVDEYQDTNDVGEYFVSLISNNNVYMVGDIKQSIYRFRNANPYIFKSKYDLYSSNENGIKIDLVKNFRSRDEVLNNINLIFNELMDDNLGGANYKESHQMVFGNMLYNEDGKTEQNYNFEIYEYDTEDKKFTNCEKEIFIIGNDIKKKIDSKYKIFDKDENILRDIEYKDFVILIDRATDFDLYKKVFEYLGIPLTLYKDEELDSGNDILLIRNILKIENAIDKDNYDEEFKYAFLSVGRSYLFDLSDEELLKTFTNNSFKESIIYKKCLELYNYYYEVSPKVFFLKLLEIFDYENNLLKTNNIAVNRIRLEYFYNLLDSFENNGNTINEFIEYLDLIFDSSEKTRFSIGNNNSNSVKIMTIHKSKGLEYPICYYSLLYKEFSFRDLTDSILYNNKYGIIIPYFNDYSKDTIYKILLKNDTKKEEISEKIRLLYVALTRAKEKMILLIPKIDEDKINIHNTYYDKGRIKSFLDMIYYVYNYINPYIKYVDVNPTKDYLFNNKDNNINNLIEEDNINIEEISFEKEVLEEKHFSKSSVKLFTKEEITKLDFGSKIHEKLELLDFKNPNYNLLNSLEKEKIKLFLESDLIKENINSKFYKEYEFIYEEEDSIKHGIIDLMIESNDKIIIIDYKLKNIEDDAYKEQLLGYKSYISKITNKKIELYLYSILDSKYQMIS